MEPLVEELKQKIIDFLNLEDVEADEIQADAPLITEGLGLDSIDLLELVVMLEKEYKIKIKTKDDAKVAFQSLSTLAKYVRDHSEQ